MRDARRQTLFCARDHLGIKPFYYAHDGEQFLFASEPKAILSALRTKPRANNAAMRDYLAFSYVLSDETMFEGIWRLPPASRMTVDANGTRIETYWDPAFAAETRWTESDVVDELRALLSDAMRLQIRSDVPVGAPSFGRHRLERGVLSRRA